MCAGVIGIVLEHLMSGPVRELPVAGLPRDARDSFEREQSLRPRVGTWRRSQCAHRLLEHLAALLFLAGVQKEFALEGLKGRRDETAAFGAADETQRCIRFGG